MLIKIVRMIDPFGSVLELSRPGSVCTSNRVRSMSYRWKPALVDTIVAGWGGVLRVVEAILNRLHDSSGVMKIIAAIACIVLAGCSGDEIVQTAEALNIENVVRACMTDEVLREAHATDEEIRQFKKEQAEAGAVTCG
jgi:hypothetical protein